MPIRLPKKTPQHKPPLASRPSWYRFKRRAERILLQSYDIPKPFTIPQLRLRPCFGALTFLVMLCLALLGVHPTLSGKLKLNDKIQHFIGLTIATGLFYWIFDVDNASRRVIWWRLLPEVVTVVVCGFGGCIVSEFVQSLLPYKTFQWGDVLANLLGASLGLGVARVLARRRRHRQELSELYQPLDELESDTDEEARIGLTAVDAEMAESPALPAAFQTRQKKSSADDPWADSDGASIFSIGDGEEEQPPTTETRPRTL